MNLYPFHLRPVHELDAAALLALWQDLEKESPYVMISPGERHRSIREEQGDLRHLLAQPNQMMWVVEDRDQLIAWLGAWGEPYLRLRHSVILGLGVRQAYRRQGLATGLFAALHAWAPPQAIRRLELTVAVENHPAILLYQQQGFQIEGTKRQSYRIGDRLVDEYLMGKLLP